MKWFGKKAKAAELPDGLRYRAFLSYRTGDKKIAEWLHKKIEHYRVPRKLVGTAGRHGPIPARVGPIFRDRDDARSAQDIETLIAYELSRSQHLIVLCTPRATEKEAWVGREIELFRERRSGAEIHAVIGDGEPPNCFPKQLLSYEPDGKLRQPLAADLRSRRHGGDGKVKAVIRLIAALIGTEFDDLWQRERRRRTIRLGFFAVPLVVLGVFVESAWWANQNSLPFGYVFIKPLWALGLYTPLPHMAEIPAGKFTMGCVEGRDDVEIRCYDDDTPAHEVTIARPFTMGTHEVTFLQYDYYVWSQRRRGHSNVIYPSDSGWGRFNRPVINVNSEEAKTYTGWLSKKTGKQYRLPTEAEWEYAARAGTETAFWWGPELGKDNANCDVEGSQWGGKMTAPAGSFPPNPWGIYDTAGNIYEWVEDDYHDDYKDAPSDGSARKGGHSFGRVVRGGSWHDKPGLCRAAFRYGNLPNLRGYLVGFRVCCAAPIK